MSAPDEAIARIREAMDSAEQDAKSLGWDTKRLGRLGVIVERDDLVAILAACCPGRRSDAV